MKPAIPNSGTVDSTFRTLEKRLKKIRKKINAQAAREMKDEDYGSAQQWMEIGHSVADFAKRAEAFAQEWKRMAKAARIANAASGQKETPKIAIGTRSAKTPAWKFCTPALQIVLSKGGTASHDQVLAGLDGSMTADLTEKDRKPKGAANAPRWHGAVKRAVKLCQREGWIEKRTDGVWKVTAKGRAVVSREEEKEPGAHGSGQASEEQSTDV